MERSRRFFSFQSRKHLPDRVDRLSLSPIFFYPSIRFAIFFFFSGNLYGARNWWHHIWIWNLIFLHCTITDDVHRVRWLIEINGIFCHPMTLRHNMKSKSAQYPPFRLASHWERVEWPLFFPTPWILSVFPWRFVYAYFKNTRMTQRNLSVYWLRMSR